MWCLGTAAILLLFFSTGVAAETTVQRFLKYRTEYKAVVAEHWQTMPMQHIPCGKIEQESWWKPGAELKTSREYGFGLGQITITPRFNNFEEAKKLKPLKSWAWEDRYNVKYQLTYSVLTDKANFKFLEPKFLTNKETWAATLVAYNAGMGTVLQRRTQAQKMGLNHSVWFGGLDKAFLSYENKLLYNRNLGLMRNDYPVLVFKKAEKYKLLLEE